jgi:hypothetical protein
MLNGFGSPVLVHVVAAPPMPDGVGGPLQQLIGEVLTILGWVGGIAFLAAGGMFLFAYFGQFESNRAVRALAAACIGCIVVSAAGGIGSKILQGSQGMKGAMTQLGVIRDWILTALSWAGGVAFVCVGGVFLFAYFGGNGSSRAVRALAGAAIGCIIISASSLIAQKLLAHTA